MKAYLYCVLLFVNLFFSNSVHAEGSIKSLGIVAGSIRDIAPELKYLDWKFSWRAMVGAPGNVGLIDEQIENLNTYLSQNSQSFCGKYLKTNKLVFAGLDNVTFGTRHFEDNNERGSLVLATFNIYCATK